MSTPIYPGDPFEAPAYTAPVNASNQFVSSGSMAEFASWSDSDWKLAIADLWRTKTNPVGNATGILRSFTHALTAAFQGDVTLIQALAEGISDNPFVQALMNAFYEGYYHTPPPVGVNPNDLKVTMANVDNRITALEGSGVRFSITSSTTIDLSERTKIARGVLIGSAGAATNGGTGPGGTGGVPGGYLELPEIDVAWLATQVPDISAVEVHIGTAGGESWFGTRSDGSKVFQTLQARKLKVDGFSFTPCESGPGAGGDGGNGYYTTTETVDGTTTGVAHPASAGKQGTGSILCPLGGAGGAGSASLDGSPGSNGVQAPIDGPVKDGGSGGGGGGGGGTYGFGGGRSGGAGGHGAFPGGGPGGGGGRAANTFPGSVGAAGSPANGYAELEAA